VEPFVIAAIFLAYAAAFVTAIVIIALAAVRYPKYAPVMVAFAVGTIAFYIGLGVGLAKVLILLNS
jgi:hypothetical protein